MDFHLDTLLNLPNVVADSYSSTLDAIVVKLQKELTVKQVSVAGDPPRSENEKMSVAGHPRRSEDAVQDIFHKIANSQKKTGEILND